MAAQGTYTVSGMTCDQCVRSVTEEVQQLPGVQAVEVDLSTGRLTIESDQPLTDDAVRAAVVEAGYELASTPA